MARCPSDPGELSGVYKRCYGPVTHQRAAVRAIRSCSGRRYAVGPGPIPLGGEQVGAGGFRSRARRRGDVPTSALRSLQAGCQRRAERRSGRVGCPTLGAALSEAQRPAQGTVCRVSASSGSPGREYGSSDHLRCAPLSPALDALAMCGAVVAALDRTRPLLPAFLA